MRPLAIRFHFCILSLIAMLLTMHPAQAQRPFRLAIAGLVHGHVDGMLRLAGARSDVEIVGIYEPKAELAKRYAERYSLPQQILYTDLKTMLEAVKPDAVSTFTNTFDHAMVVEACATHNTPVMMEKPLAVSMAHATRIQAAAKLHKIAVIVNYETSWYPSHAAIWQLTRQNAALGAIRKVVAMDGHQGPKEIGVGADFLSFLTDPKLNGAGALFDFGCYGANLMTWLMDNQRPIAVYAITQQFKPQIYPHVDDEATIIVEYAHAQGIIQASWNWPVGRKDLEVYGAKGYAIATGGSTLRVRLPDRLEEAIAPSEVPATSRDGLAYLVAVVRSEIKPSGLSSLENNMIVTEILEAAKKSAQTGKRVILHP